MSETDSLWGYEEVADYLGITPKTARKWANERRLPVVKVGSLNKFRPADIRAWVESRSEPVEDAC